MSWFIFSSELLFPLVYLWFIFISFSSPFRFNILDLSLILLHYLLLSIMSLITKLIDYSINLSISLSYHFFSNFFDVLLTIFLLLFDNWFSPFLLFYSQLLLELFEFGIVSPLLFFELFFNLSFFSFNFFLFSQLCTS
jgi:hypothetical protein